MIATQTGGSEPRSAIAGSIAPQPPSVDSSGSAASEPEQLASIAQDRNQDRNSDNAELAERVRVELSAHQRFEAVEVSAVAGTVTLTGEVFDDGWKARAEKIAQNASGVNAVVNNLTTTTGKWQELENQANADLVKAGLDKVTVKIIGGDAYLHGQVGSDADKTRAESVIQNGRQLKIDINMIEVVNTGWF